MTNRQIPSHQRFAGTLAFPPMIMGRQFEVLHERLGNGLPVYVVPVPHSQAASVHLLVRAGSSCDEIGLEGTAHFLEHAMLCGSKHFPDSESLFRSVGKFGGEIDAETSKEDTAFIATIPVPFVEQALFALADTYFDPSFPESGVENELEVIRDEARLDQDSLYTRCSETLEEMMLNVPHLTRPILGDQDSIGRISIEVLRRFRDRWYRPENCVLIVAGAFDAAVFPTLAKYFDRPFTPCAQGDSVSPDTTGQIQTSTDDRLRYVELPRSRTVVGIGYPLGPERTLPESELVLTEIILGRSSFCRLDKALRLSKGIAYQSSCGRATYRECGYFEVNVEVSPSRVSRALQTTLATIAELRDGGVTSDELADAINCATGRALLALEGSHDFAAFVADEIATQGSVTPPDEYIARVNSVTLDQINGYLTKLFDPATCRISIAGGRHKSFDPIKECVVP